MLSVIIMGLLAGALFIYGLPHLVAGASGKTRKTPLGDAAMVNITFGWLSWVIAVLLWHTAPMARHPRATFLAVAAGILLMGWYLAGSWAAAPRRRSKEA